MASSVPGIVLSVAIWTLICRCAHAQTMPTGCSYSDGLYDCDYDTLSGNGDIPLSAAGFTPIAQRIRITYTTDATLSTAQFDTDFASIATASYDTNYPATLELECVRNTGLTLSAGFLANMDHIEDFKIINCKLNSIPASAFSELGTLDRFQIENGTITAIDDGALIGINIIRNSSVTPSYPKQHGEFSIKNTKYSGGTSFPGAVLSGQTSLYSLVLRNMGVTEVDTSMLSAATGIHYLDLSYNTFTSVPSTLFDSLTSLGVVSMYGYDIECMCDNLWMLEYATTNYITLNGDMLCNSTAGYENKLAWAFYHDTCVTAADACAGGIALAGACLTAIDMTGFVLGTIAFILGWVVLGLVCHTQKQMGQAKGNGRKPGGKPGGKRPPPKRAPKGGWA